jgi:hypothetical protein
VKKAVAQEDYHPPVQRRDFDWLAQEGLQLELATIACGRFG